MRLLNPENKFAVALFHYFLTYQLVTIENVTLGQSFKLFNTQPSSLSVFLFVPKFFMKTNTSLEGFFLGLLLKMHNNLGKSFYGDNLKTYFFVHRFNYKLFLEKEMEKLKSIFRTFPKV